MKKNKFFFTASLILVMSCSTKIQESKIFITECQSKEVQALSFSRVIESPAYFDSKYVEVSGFYESGFEKSQLYDSKKHSKQSKSLLIILPEPNALFLKMDNQIRWNQNEADSMNRKKVKLIGRFTYYHNDEIMGNEIGSLSDICYIQIWDR